MTSSLLPAALPCTPVWVHLHLLQCSPRPRPRSGCCARSSRCDWRPAALWSDPVTRPRGAGAGAGGWPWPWCPAPRLLAASSAPGLAEGLLLLCATSCSHARWAAGTTGRAEGGSSLRADDSEAVSPPTGSAAHSPGARRLGGPSHSTAYARATQGWAPRKCKPPKTRDPAPQLQETSEKNCPQSGASWLSRLAEAGQAGPGVVDPETPVGGVQEAAHGRFPHH